MDPYQIIIDNQIVIFSTGSKRRKYFTGQSYKELSILFFEEFHEYSCTTAVSNLKKPKTNGKTIWQFCNL